MSLNGTEMGGGHEVAVGVAPHRVVSGNADSSGDGIENARSKTSAAPCTKRALTRR